MDEPEREPRTAFESSLDDARAAADDGGLVVGAVREPASKSVEAAILAVCDEVLTQYLTDAVPGPELMQFLIGWPLRELGPTSLLAWMRAHARCTAWWAAREAEALVAFAGATPQQQTFEVRGEQVVLEDVAREELAASMRWTSNFAATRIEEARLLVGSLPATKSAMDAGDVSPAHVRVVVESARRLSATAPVGSREFSAACGQLEKRILPVAVRSGLGALRTAANKAVSAIDPLGRSVRRDAALQRRGVWLRDEPDGVATLIARMATEHAYACYAAVEKLAASSRFGGQPASSGGDSDGGGSDGGTLGERRSLALLHLTLGDGQANTSASDGRTSASVTGAHPSASMSDAHTNLHVQGAPAVPEPVLRTHVDVIIDLPTLLGLQDNDGEIVGGGELAGDTIRALVASDSTATMRRLITDPVTGHLLDIGRKRYVIPDAMREFIVIRDQRCRFPGCTARAAGGEVDHAVPWDAGGGSDRDNLGALCKRHHQVKTIGGWTITNSDRDGSCTWVSPTGNRYAHDAVAVGVESAHEAGVPLADGVVRETGDLVNDDP